MGSATARRFALVAALVALAAVWLRPVATATGPTAAPLDAAFARLVSPTHGPAPSIRRQANAGSWVHAIRPLLGRALLALAVAALLVMLRLAPWATVAAVAAAASSLVRRRHVITLRAPPVTSCA